MYETGICFRCLHEGALLLFWKDLVCFSGSVRGENPLTQTDRSIRLSIERQRRLEQGRLYIFARQSYNNKNTSLFSDCSLRVLRDLNVCSYPATLTGDVQ